MKKKMTKKEYFKKLMIQKVAGLAILLISALLVYVASTGTTIQDRDASFVILLIPFGLYLLITKNIVFYYGGK